MFDVLDLVDGLDNALHVDARGDDVVGVDAAEGDDDLRLRDGDLPGGGDDRVEVPRGVPVDQVPVGVRGVGVDQGQVRDDAALAHVEFAVELLDGLALGDQGADARLGVEGGDACAPGAEPFGEGALRDELDLEVAGEILLGEALVLAHVGGQHLADLAGVDEHTEALAVDAHVVGDDGQVPDPGVADRVDQVDGNAAEPEAADGDGDAVGQDVRHGLGRAAVRIFPRGDRLHVHFLGVLSLGGWRRLNGS